VHTSGICSHAALMCGDVYSLLSLWRRILLIK
jgi:hypothetical protein